MIVIYKTDKPRTSKHLLRVFVIVNLVGKHLTKILTVVSTTKNDFPIHLRSLPKVSSRQSFNQEVTNIIKRLRAKFCKSASYFRFSELSIEIFKEILKCACTSSKGTWPASSHILMMPACMWLPVSGLLLSVLSYHKLLISEDDSDTEIDVIQDSIRRHVRKTFKKRFKQEIGSR